MHTILKLGNFSLHLLRGGSETDIPINGSGRVRVTDISNSGEEDGLLCRYKAYRWQSTDNFLWAVGRRRDLTLIPRPNLDIETETNYLGWVSESDHSAPYLRMRLYRVPDVVAKENVFICSHSDNKDSISVGIFYPSE